MTVNVARHRQRSENKYTRPGYSFYTYQNPGVPNTGLGGYNGSYRWMADVITSGFQKLRAKGDIVMNQMTSFKNTCGTTMLSNIAGRTNPGANPEQWFYDVGDLTHICCGGTLNWAYPTFSGFNLVSDSDLSALIQQVSTECRSQIGRSDAANWENLAELNKTFQMLESPLASWFKFSRKAKLATAGLSAANAWLAYRYGIRPLVSSVDETLKAYAKHANSGVYDSRVTTRASGVLTASSSDTFRVPAASDSYQTLVQRERKEKVIVRAMSLDTIRMDAQHYLGLGSKDLLTLPWELVPYSFVVDWFFNVGSFIGAITQSLYPASLGQCYTVTREQSETRTSLSVIPPPNYQLDSSRLGKIRAECVLKTRTPGLVGPGLVLKSDFRFDQLTRLADAFALSGQQLLRVFSSRR